jgi:hypothetical protein
MFKIMGLALFMLFVGTGFAQACTVQTIVTDRGIVSCYICPNMPPSCSKV